jgi:uncharacterized protein (TIGR02246 family)
VTKSVCFYGFVLLGAASAVAQQGTTKTQPTTGASHATSREIAREAEPIQQALQSYINAFNKHDAKALAALWMTQGVYVDRSTGERIEGRDALEQDFAATFREKPTAHLDGNVQSVRFIRPDVASADGQAAESDQGDDSGGNKTAFSAIFVRENGRWLIDSIQEIDLPTSQSEPVSLNDVAWMVGHWVDKSDEARVDTVCRWAPRHAFLVRSFTIETSEDNGPEQGTEIIGWDPKTKQIRSWMFLSDGSFGEAIWTKNGKDWERAGTQTLADGCAASGMQVISRVDDNTMTVEMIAEDIDGEPRPASDPLTVVRVPDDKPQDTSVSSSSTRAQSKEDRP